MLRSACFAAGLFVGLWGLAFLAIDKLVMFQPEERDPAEVRAPGDGGRGGHGPQAGDHADQKGEDVEGHARAPKRQIGRAHV